VAVKVASIVGARPQFIKAAPVSKQIRRRNQEVLIHTGQHYDENMSAVFFESLGIAEPDYNLGIGSASHGYQTGQMLIAIEEVLLKEEPDIALVFGDTNSTLAGALAAAKLGIPIGHVEAGLRSYNREMPEEINRIVADHISNLLFCPTETAVSNLRIEGIEKGVHLVGDVMYDVALHNAPIARKRNIRKRLELGLKGYLLVTVHRPGNTDVKRNLKGIVDALIQCKREVVFTIHPRTRKFLIKYGLFGMLESKVRIVEPLDYLDFLALLMDAEKVLTDSGGVQKEAYFFGIPCITLRNETEWMETVQDKWNVLVGAETKSILRAIKDFNPEGTRGKSFGDGHASEKICKILEEFR